MATRAYADLAQNLRGAGYSDAEEGALKREVELYAEVRAVIKRHSGVELDIEPYEADKRLSAAGLISATRGRGRFADVALLLDDPLPPLPVPA